MKDAYLQSGGVGLVHDLEGQVRSVCGLSSYFGFTAFSFSQFRSYLQFTFESTDFFEMFKWNN